jgi:outer membrane protein assembly factor BamD (BamD/ComL family)
MRELRILSVMALLAMSFVISTSIASQDQKTEISVPVSESDNEALLRTVATLVRQSQYGGESFGAAMREFTILEEKHRDSVMAPLLAAILDGMHEEAAMHEFKIAMFNLYKRGAKEGAELRLRYIVEKYPKYSRMDEVLYQLSLLESESSRPEEAIQTLERLVSEFEFSPRISDAQSRLKALKAGK